MSTLAQDLNQAYQLHLAGQLAAAEACYQRVLQLDPQNVAALHMLGVIAYQTGRYQLAIDLIRRALAREPKLAEAHSNLGLALQKLGQFKLATESFQQAVKLKPNYAEAFNNLGVALRDAGELDAAMAALNQALAIKPNYAEAFLNLGNAQKDQGELDNAIRSYRSAAEIMPQQHGAFSNLLYTITFCPQLGPHAIRAEHDRWNQQYAEPFARTILPHSNVRDPQRRLRIGYVSPDFRRHPVGRYMLPLLENHDHQDFHITCYSTSRGSDDVTQRIQATADVWQEVAADSDDQLAARIRHDQIDILVDLTMHMANHRLLVFARKPSPVQVTYLAYPGTTGLRVIDYRLTDRYLDPDDQPPGYYSEESIRLPETAWCYSPAGETPPVNDLPAVRNGFITFGCLNNFFKLSPAAIAVWSELLRTIPTARMLIQAKQGRHRDLVAAQFAQQGVSPERLFFADRAPLFDFLRLHHHIDIALDPFPCAGATTTCDALWMGVPVVSLCGQLAVERCGLSMLSNVGLPELVATTTDKYQQIAQRLAADLPRLATLRQTLRQRMIESPLMNAPRFARHVENAYREMWQRYCTAAR